nr:cholinesterase [Quercus suber]
MIAAACLLPLAEMHFVPKPGCDQAIGRPVRTTSGVVHGHSAPNATTVSEYLGIPFAKPPVGSLRFEPPVRYFGSGKLTGTNFGPVCPQLGGSIAELSSVSSTSSNASALPQNAINLLSSLAATGQSRSEDCLTINVWTKPQTGSRKKPVMVWIYGGGFGEGEGSVPAYSGQYWAEEEDVVFVNFKYVLKHVGLR